MESLKSFINKFYRELKWTLLAVTASLVISIFAVLFTNESSLLAFFSILSTLLSLITTFVVIKLFDEFDSKKVKFARTVDAIDELVAKITSIPLCLNYFKVGTMTNIKSAEIFLNKKASGRIYFDKTGIEILKEENQDYNIYFTEEILKFFEEIQSIFFNPWIPREIKDDIKGVLVFNTAQPYNVVGDKNEFIIISKTIMDNQVKDFSYYKISYVSKMHNKKVEIFSLKDLSDYSTSLINTILKWYEINMNFVPDLTGY